MEIVTAVDRARAVARRWPLLLVGALLGLALGLVATKMVATGYVADAKAFVVVAGKQDTADMSAASSYAEGQMSSYETAATSPLVLDPVIDKLKLDMSASELAKQVTATATSKSFVLDIMVEDSDPERAASIANAIASQMDAAIKTLTPLDQAGAKPLNAVTITPASADDTVSSSSLVRNVAGLGLLGVLTGLALALMLEALSASRATAARTGGPEPSPRRRDLDSTLDDDGSAV
ncbi:hypothetical protein [Luteococcus sp.]|uniref:hypothetical protein n=1 Tax=Luteococcus sp. TaxID=1969402 RepID=UPI0026495F5A|nr:hypothetical protein [Luteococcus sp.]